MTGKKALHSSFFDKPLQKPLQKSNRLDDSVQAVFRYLATLISGFVSGFFFLNFSTSFWLYPGMA